MWIISKTSQDDVRFGVYFTDSGLVYKRVFQQLVVSPRESIPGPWEGTFGELQGHKGQNVDESGKSGGVKTEEV